MACGRIVLNELNIPIECYVSSEIDKHAIKAEKQNFPDIIQVGSVTEIDVAELVGKYGVPDFIFGGSPCQSFSMSGKMNGMSTVQGEEVYTLGRYLELSRKALSLRSVVSLLGIYENPHRASQIQPKHSVLLGKR